jgi:hypothetical protein
MTKTTQTVQLLIERGCQYAARNNQGFTASDYAYSFVPYPIVSVLVLNHIIISFSTKETLQDTARMQFENNKKQRRNIFAQAAARGNEWGGILPSPPPVPAKNNMTSRMRSGSGTSRTTATSDSGEPDNLITSQSSSPTQQFTGSMLFGHSLSSYRAPLVSPSNGTTSQVPPGSTKGSLPLLSPPPNPASALSPIANRMRERDADAMEKYLLRSRSGSQGTSSTDTKSQNGSTFASAGPSANGDDITALISGSVTPRRLRPSMSAAQLRTTQPSNTSGSGKSIPQADTRTGSSTSPTTSTTRGVVSPIPLLTRSTSMTKSLRSIASADQLSFDEPEKYTGPPSVAARFPSATNGRRKGFHILSKPLPSFETSTGSSHRRKTSATSTRGS